jgi:hypothetical protein
MKRRWLLGVGLALVGLAIGGGVATYWFAQSDSAEPAGTRAQAVVHGIVESVGGDRWNTADGQPPVDRSTGRIYRVARIRVLDTVAGAVEFGTIEVAVDGGMVGNVFQTPGYGAAELFPGDEVVLFLTPSDGAEAPYPDWYVNENWIVDPDSGIATAQYRNEDPLMRLHSPGGCAHGRRDVGTWTLPRGNCEGKTGRDRARLRGS